MNIILISAVFYLQVSADLIIMGQVSADLDKCSILCLSSQ